MQERKSIHLKFCPYYTTQPQVAWYLIFFLKKPVNTTQVKMEGYLKKNYHATWSVVVPETSEKVG